MMRNIDTSLFLDIADSLGISSPAIVEKDYWGTQLLREIAALQPDGYRLVFSGGTCLAKAYKNTFRMSEDIDIKMVPNAATRTLSNSQQHKLRGAIHDMIKNIVASSDCFELVDAKKLSDRKFQQFLIQYPREHETSSALRPHIQLDLTESVLLEDPVNLPLGSLYAYALKESVEINGMACVTVNSVAIEKFVSLLRRTALHSRDGDRADDQTLIRHVYDLHLISNSLDAPDNLQNLVEQVIDIDKKQFGNQHIDFVVDAKNELRYGLSLLLEQPQHEARYKQFIGPLVYHPSPDDWHEAISTVQSLAEKWL